MFLEIGQETDLNQCGGDHFPCNRIIESLIYGKAKKQRIFVISNESSMYELSPCLLAQGKAIVVEVFDFQLLNKLKVKRESRILTLFFNNGKVIIYELQMVDTCVNSITRAMERRDMESILQKRRQVLSGPVDLMDSYLRVIKRLEAEFCVIPTIDLVHEIMNLLRQAVEYSSANSDINQETYKSVVQYTQQFLRRDDVVRVLNDEVIQPSIVTTAPSYKISTSEVSPTQLIHNLSLRQFSKANSTGNLTPRSHADLVVECLGLSQSSSPSGLPRLDCIDHPSATRFRDELSRAPDYSLTVSPDDDFAKDNLEVDFTCSYNSLQDLSMRLSVGTSANTPFRDSSCTDKQYLKFNSENTAPMMSDQANNNLFNRINVSSVSSNSNTPVLIKTSGTSPESAWLFENSQDAIRITGGTRDPISSDPSTPVSNRTAESASEAVRLGNLCNATDTISSTRETTLSESNTPLLNCQRERSKGSECNYNNMANSNKTGLLSVYSPNINRLLSSSPSSSTLYVDQDCTNSSTGKYNIHDLITGGNYGYGMQGIGFDSSSYNGKDIRMDNDCNNGDTMCQDKLDPNLGADSSRLTESKPVRIAINCILKYDDANNHTPVLNNGIVDSHNSILLQGTTDYATLEFLRPDGLHDPVFETLEDVILNGAASRRDDSGSNMSLGENDHSISESQSLEKMLEDITQAFETLTESFSKSP